MKICILKFHMSMIKLKYSCIYNTFILPSHYQWYYWEHGCHMQGPQSWQDAYNQDGLIINRLITGVEKMLQLPNSH